ncbi:MAG: MBL fold metallo-hydrolase, partial [Candidatus Firestonebacteria bacterium]|nr:MBL fold metallo-hydrolase [Candidatus Firestonebacteria bacterium]
MHAKIAEGVYWVGATDWNIRLFHGFDLSTHRGSSYNAYLIVDEKIALIDTVWTPFQDELLANIREIVDPSKIDYIIANHSETDHAGSLPVMLAAAPQAALITSKRGLDSFPGHHHQPMKIQAVQTGDKISLGKSELVFVEAPMLHWPDSMFTYLTGKNILFSNDAFGQHYAAHSHFNDEVNQEELYQEALKYYANILTPYCSQVTKKIEELTALNLPLDMIAPSHGIIWRKDPLQIVKQYQIWAQQKPEPTALILFDTMWEATRRMSEAVGHGLAAQGIAYKILHTAVTDRNDIITEIFKTKAVILGSPTLNNGLLPTIMPILEDLKGLKFKNKIGAAFGSYGWSGESVKLLEEILSAAKIPVAAPGVR